MIRTHLARQRPAALVVTFWSVESEFGYGRVSPAVAQARVAARVG